MSEVLGQAIWDYHNNGKPAKLWIYNNYGPREEMPVHIYFRDEAAMPELELKALQACRGAVLDVGAGAGSHALVLQQKGINVTAMDISAMAAKVMLARGVKTVVNQDVFQYAEKKFDTLLLLMNGIGLTGSITNLSLFLQHAKKLLLPGGQLVFDSSNIAYLYDGNLPATGGYYGELTYEYGYKNKKSGWFKWLYIDKDTLLQVAHQEGWEMELLFEDRQDQYLVRLIAR